jgi:tRNA A-37 threonylcarbamoyl transferase component Bud32
MSEGKLQELVERWQKLRDLGDPPSSEELCRDCPELLPALRERLDAQNTGEVASATLRPNALILDPAGRFEAEQSDTLRRRLRLVALVYLTHWVLYFGIAAHADERPASYAVLGVELSVETTVVLLMTLRQNWSHRSLRWIEACLFGMVLTRITVGQSIFLSGGVLSEIMGEPDELKLILLIDAMGIPWLLAILVYGVFIPNTTVRSAVMVSIGAVLPLVLIAAFARDAGYLSDPWVHHGMRRMGTHLAIACAIAVFSSYGIDRLRHEVRVARKLGQYVLKRRLGVGGMGEVYLAEHQLLRRLCAIKLIRADKATSPLARQRFEREAKVMAGLRHPNIVDVFDYGVTPDGTFFYVMEYVSGRTLRELVEETGPVPATRAVAILRQVAIAVGAAHRQGLIHRDIKPANIIVCQGPNSAESIKLLDFGLVHMSLADGRPLTMDGRILGTPAFMSPEQIAGTRALDRRSDIYSIGVMAIFLLTGRNPFELGEVRQIFAAHLDEAAQPLNLSHIGTDLEAVVRRCLAKDPADRFADAESLERALAACAAVS